MAAIPSRPATSSKACRQYCLCFELAGKHLQDILCGKAPLLGNGIKALGCLLNLSLNDETLNGVERMAAGWNMVPALGLEDVAFCIRMDGRPGRYGVDVG
jgi:hypothetical protein